MPPRHYPNNNNAIARYVLHTLFHFFTCNSDDSEINPELILIDLGWIEVAVKHFPLLCKHYEELRNELKKVGARSMRTEILLRDPKIVKDTLEYVEKTGRFNFV